MRRIVGYDYILVLFALVLFSVVTVFNVFSCPSNYHTTIVLPIVYVFGYCFWGIKSPNTAVLIKKLVMLLMAVKMVLLPGLILINHGLLFTKSSPSVYNYIPNAVIMQVLEYAVVLYFLTFSEWSDNSIEYNPLTLESRTEEKNASKNAYRVMLFCLLVLLGVIIIYPAFLYGLRPIFFLNEANEILWRQNVNVAHDALPAIIYYPISWLFSETRLALAYMVVMKVYRLKCFPTGIKIFLSLASTVIILILIVPDSVATSIYAALTLFLLLYILYPHSRRIIVFVVVFVCILILLGAFVLMPIVSGRGASLNYIASKINAYFSGYLNTSASVVMDADLASKIELFFGDFFRSLPIIRGFFTSMPMSNELFNVASGFDPIYYSQIIPLEGQGYFYFGHFGVIAFTIIQMVFLKRSYHNMLTTHSSFTFYVYGITTLLLVFGLVMYNLFLTFSLILSQIPLLLISHFFCKQVI